MHTATLSLCLLLCCALLSLAFGASVTTELKKAVGGPYTLKVIAHYPDENIKPKNSALFLRGSSLGLNWNSGAQMKYEKQNTWSYNLQFSDAQVNSTVEIKVLVGDSQWMIGANDIILLKVISGLSSYQFDSYPFFYTSQGTIEFIRKVYSPQLDNTRDITLYIPPSFYENPLKPVDNVLVMHDGQNLFDPKTAFMGNPWWAQNTLNEQLVAGKMQEVMIVGVYNTEARLDELTYSRDKKYGGGKADLYLDFVQNEVMKQVISKYGSRVQTKQRNMGIAGSSLGGLVSCYAVWTRSAVFSKGTCMSSSFWWNNEDFNSVILQRAAPSNITIYLDSGDAGDSQDDKPQTIAVRDHLLSITPQFKLNKNVFYYLDRGASHSETYWSKRFWIPMTSLYPPSPKAITSSG